MVLEGSKRDKFANLWVHVIVDQYCRSHLFNFVHLRHIDEEKQDESRNARRAEKCQRGLESHTILCVTILYMLPCLSPFNLMPGLKTKYTAMQRAR